jgi:vitamin B12 transporter
MGRRVEDRMSQETCQSLLPQYPSREGGLRMSSLICVKPQSLMKVGAFFIHTHLKEVCIMQPRCHVLNFLAFVVFTSAIAADKDTTKTYHTEDVVVTATRVGRPMFDIGRTVNVITSEKFQVSPVNDIGDVLSKEGVGFISGATLNPGMQQSLFLRGSNSNQTSIFFDDIRLTDPSTTNNAPNLIELSLANVERIEIVRGSHSTMYGSSAIGGVVNIISRSNRFSGFHANADITAGTYGSQTSTLSQNIFLNYSLPAGIYVNAALANCGVKGLDATMDTITNPLMNRKRDHDGFQKLNLIGKIGYRNENWDVHMSFLQVRQESDIDKGAFTDDDNARLDYERQLWTVGASYSINDEINFKYIGGYSPIKRHTIDDSSVVNLLGTTDHSFSEDTFKGITSSNEFLFNIGITGVHMEVGVGTQRETMTQQSYLYQGSIYGIYESRTNLDTLHLSSTLNHIFFHTEIDGTIFDQEFENLTIALGLRLNKHSSYGNNFTYEVNPLYRISKNSLLFISYSTGFNAPSLYQLYCPTTYYTSDITRGNAWLDPETSSSIEFGWKYRISDRAYFMVSYFNTITENSIEYVYLWDKNIGLDTLGNDWMRDDYRGDTYLNIGKQTTHGMDLIFDVQITDFLAISGSASLITGKLTYDPRNIQNRHIEGNRVQLYSNGAFVTREIETINLVRRPSSCNLNIQYKPMTDITDILTQFDIRYVGSRYDAYYNNTIGPWGALDVLKLGGYTLLGLAVRYELNTNLSFNLRIENILDTQYSEILGYTTKGRALYLSTMFSF